MALLLFGLAACNKSSGDDFDVTVMNERMGFRTIEVDVVIPEAIDDLDDLFEITLDIARQTYNSHFSDIGTDHYTMTIRLYKTESDYDDRNPTYGSHTFEINETLSHPGLTTGENNLKIN
jgi:hypothetical protein